jgi:nucleoside-diphosphate-sugar epimerase
MEMRIVITGASGFIGWGLYNQNWKDHEVIGTYNTTQKKGLTKCDCMDFNDVIKVTKDADIVFMLATKSFGVGIMAAHPESLVRDNIIMNVNTLEACRINGVKRVVYLSSSTVYHEAYKKLEESDLDLNKDPYRTYLGVAWVKRYTEKLIQFYNTFGITSCILRPTYVYGPQDKLGAGAHFLPAIIQRITNATDTVTVWGNGHAQKNCIYIDDMISAMNAVTFDTNTDIYNICSNHVYSIREIVNKIIDISKKDISISYDTSKPEAIPFRDLSRKKFDSKYGKLNETPINVGIRKTMEWIKDLC